MPTPDDPQANQPVFEVDPEFGEMAVRMGQVWKLPGISLREKAFLCLANDICEMNLGLSFEMHIMMALANDVTTLEIKEVLYHLAPETGYPKVLQAIVRMKEVAKNRDLPPLPEDDGATARRSERFSVPIEVLGKLCDADEDFEQLFQEQVEERWNRPALSPKERAYISLAADVAAQTLGAPFAFHCDAALRNGASEEQIRKVLLFMSEFSFSKAWQAFEVFSERFAFVQHSSTEQA